MRASLAYTMRRSVSAALFGASLAIGAPVPACANVITDWDDKALVLVTPMTAVGATSPYMAQRVWKEAPLETELLIQADKSSSAAAMRCW